MYYILKTAEFILCKIPIKYIHKIGKILGFIWFYLIRIRREVVIDNLTKSFKNKYSKQEINQIALSTYVNICIGALELLRMPQIIADGIDNYVEIENEHHINNALKKGKGILILCAHFGNWDLLAVERGIKTNSVSIVTKESTSKGISQYWKQTRESFGVKFHKTKWVLFDLFKELKKNKIVGIIIDQHYPGDKALIVNFLGRPAATSPGLAILAERSGSPVIPAFIIRTSKGTHKIIFEKPLYFKLKSPNTQENYLENTKIYTKILETYIKKFPDHWMWLHRRWKV